MATLLKTDGTITIVQPENGTNFELHELYRLLEVELIQMLEINDGLVMICDDEGKLHAEPKFNVLATLEYHKCYGPLDEIYGNALICKDEEFQ